MLLCGGRVGVLWGCVLLVSDGGGALIFEFDQQDSYTAIAAKGRLNELAAAEFRSVVNGWIASGHRRLVLDLAGTDFMDTSGLGALVGCLKSARDAGGDLRIANAGEQVLRILKLTRLDRVIIPYASVEEAFAAD